MRKPIALFAAVATMLVIAIPAVAEHDENRSPAVAQYTYDVSEVPHPGTAENENVSGTVRIKALPNNLVQVKVRLSGLTPNQPHAQHLHGSLSGDNDCPAAGLAGTAIMDGALVPGEMFIATLDAAPAYGGIQVSLTTTGDTTAAEALAIGQFPTADARGNLKYNRTFEVPAEIHEALGVLHFVTHGIDIDASGAYDGPVSALSAELPFEGTIPAGCGGPES